MSHTTKVLEVQVSKSSFVLRVVSLWPCHYNFDLLLPKWRILSDGGWYKGECLKITHRCYSIDNINISHLPSCLLLTALLWVVDEKMFYKNHAINVQRSCLYVILNRVLPGILLRRKMLCNQSLFGQILGAPWEMRHYYLLKIDCVISSLLDTLYVII